MLCGTCKCGFPAIHKCDCGERLCNECKKTHECKRYDDPEVIKPTAADVTKPAKRGRRGKDGA